MNFQKLSLLLKRPNKFEIDQGKNFKILFLQSARRTNT